MGNWWDDYSGEGFYYVDYDYMCFDSCPIPIDRFPNGVRGDPIPPNITQPEDVQVFVDDGVTIHWDGTDENPLYYYVYINGTFYESDYWWSGIGVNFQFSEISTYNITIILKDQGLNTVSDEVFVYVIQPPDPTSSSTGPTTPTTLPPIGNPVLLIPALVFTGSFVAVVVVVIVRKKLVQNEV